MFRKSFFSKRIPSFRHKKIIIFSDYLFRNLKKSKNPKYLITKNLLQRRKNFYNTRIPTIGVERFKYYSRIVKRVQCFEKPYRFFARIGIVGNLETYIPYVIGLYPGLAIHSVGFIHKNMFISNYLGLACSLRFVPYHLNICYIKNTPNNKWTYSKSSGVISRRFKSKKKNIKLVTIKLGSKVQYLFPKNCLAFLGTTPNFRIKRLCEGKWGFSFRKFKQINVRGVAMNPVDHPNGGRTKSCKPEKTPWGWVAKRNK